MEGIKADLQLARFQIHSLVLFEQSVNTEQEQACGRGQSGDKRQQHGIAVGKMFVSPALHRCNAVPDSATNE